MPQRPGIDDELNAGATTRPYLRAANGNRSALEFMVVWHEYLHEVDDLIDNEMQDKQQWIKVFAHANLVYSMDFYVSHAKELRLVVMLVTNAYCDSVLFEADSLQWKKQWADVIRHAGLEMIYAVAMICGGYDLMRSISVELKEYAHRCHHDAEGNPI